MTKKWQSILWGCKTPHLKGKLTNNIGDSNLKSEIQK